MHADPAAARVRHSLDRLVFFSDAVFAIAITLLVIDLRVPEHLTSWDNAGLTRALAGVTAQMIGFVISFVVIGVFWASHHRSFGLLACSDERLLRLNLAFLFTIVLMPFPTALMSRYQPLAIAQQIYAATLFAAVVLQLRLFVRAFAPGRYLAPDVNPAEPARILRRAWAVPVGPALAFGVSVWTQSSFSLLTLLAMPFVIRLADAQPWRQWRGSAATRVGAPPR